MIELRGFLVWLFIRDSVLFAWVFWVCFFVLGGLGCLFIGLTLVFVCFVLCFLIWRYLLTVLSARLLCMVCFWFVSWGLLGLEFYFGIWYCFEFRVCLPCCGATWLVCSFLLLLCVGFWLVFSFVVGVCFKGCLLGLFVVGYCLCGFNFGVWCLCFMVLFCCILCVWVTVLI